MSEDTRLGLSDSEVAWLQQHMDEGTVGGGLVRQYQMVVVCPRDHGARGIFAAMLDEWRASDAYPAECHSSIQGVQS